MKKIISKVIGELKQDDEFPDWWRSPKIEVPFFDNKKLGIIFVDFEPENDNTFIEESDTALTHFLKLKTEDRNAITELVYKDCMNFFELVDFDGADEMLDRIKNKIETDENKIWSFVYPKEILVERRSKNDKDIYVQIICECEWEDEHGLQFVFRQGKKLTRISSDDGHLTEADASDIPDDEDELLSKF